MKRISLFQRTEIPQKERGHEKVEIEIVHSFHRQEINTGGEYRRVEGEESLSK